MAGRPQYDSVLMFKVIFLQRCYALGDGQIHQIIDRTSFRQFLSIHTFDDIPDEKTVWNVKDKLSQSGTFDILLYCCPIKADRDLSHHGHKCA